MIGLVNGVSPLVIALIIAVPLAGVLNFFALVVAGVLFGTVGGFVIFRVRMV